MHIAFIPVQTQAKGNIVKNRHGKGVGLLKHHADITPDRYRVNILIVNINSVEMNIPHKTETPDQVVHAVNTFEHRTLTTAGRPDKTGNLISFYGDMAVPDCQKIPVIYL